MKEIQDLWDKGFKEITLLGQNVDSYLWYGGGLKISQLLLKYKSNGCRF
jgi:tRNA A37 methylthiotransferase MiaB